MDNHEAKSRSSARPASAIEDRELELKERLRRERDQAQSSHDERQHHLDGEDKRRVEDRAEEPSSRRDRGYDDVSEGFRERQRGYERRSHENGRHSPDPSFGCHQGYGPAGRQYKDGRYEGGYKERGHREHVDVYSRRSPPPQRRASPSYEPYAAGDSRSNPPRPPGPPPVRPANAPPSRYFDRPLPDASYRLDQPEHTAPGTQGGGWGRRGGGHLPDQGQGSEGSFFASRQAQRDSLAKQVVIWPESPREPYLYSDEERERRRKEKERRREERSSKGHRSSRHSRSHSHRSSRDKDADKKSRSHRHSKHSSRHSSTHKREYSTDESGSESDDSRDYDRKHRSSRRHRRREDGDERRHSSSGKRHRRSRSVASASSFASRDAHSDNERSTTRKDSENNSNALTQKEKCKNVANEDDSDGEVGPQLPVSEDGKPVDPRVFGGALLPGEGSAMAAYVAEGKRIPRRGEIGLTSERIEAFERAGFVMSGSRHKRMNAVRMRKENQVISAEEKRGILKLQKEEKMKKEAQIVSQFKEMVDTLQPPGR
ncbi:DUF926-domain-containing protein [Tilletiaria anomala UBC 951]|uniref:DUF926-domain-containing protein n=1 Tax=Tilletiaria anomala (strain ATCC 24038 / CBS 436.72 / UBC 951) TaxID=1037660 RepID=A0A066W1Z5_TILAU|nr:DUF926-domain-containing protein [Tilletiaria anomala UBC 951]KDN45104.1 DUF926-domain-containing protein [Tilletiaria anomala UBC 951]